MAFGSSAQKAVNDLILPQRMGCEVYIDNKKISPILKLNIKQHIGKHNELVMHFKHEVIQEVGLFVIEDAQTLLGRLTEVSIFNSSDPNDHPFQNKFIITEVKLVNDGLAEGVLELKGLSPTILLDGAKHFESFATQNLATLVNTVCKPMESMRTYLINTLKVNPVLEYTSRYNETAWNYLKRLADATGSWIYCNGIGLVFGAAKNEASIPLIYGSDCTKVSMSLLTVPVQSALFDYDASDNLAMKQSAKDYNGNIGSTAQDAYKRSARLYGNESVVPMQTFQANQEILTEKGKALAASKVASSYLMEAETNNFRLGIGTLVDFEFKRQGESSVHPQMRIVYSEHDLQANGMYSNHFKAVPAGAETPPKLDFEQPVTFPMLAKVVANTDPLNQGRVQVQFMGWVHDQKSRYEKQITDWIRVLSPDAGSSNLVGQNRGFVFVPEINDQVMVDFENGNPDRPFVTGSAFHGKIAAGGGGKNHLKTIITRSGAKIQLDDTDNKGSIYIEDPSGNTWYMDGIGNIEVNAPKNITINAGNNLDVNVKNNLQFNVGNKAMFNVIKQMLVTTPFLTQLVSKMYHTMAGKALINSNQEIKFESPDIYLAGQKKLFLHSDENATINSKGLVEIKGKDGNHHSNNPIAYETVKPEITAKCIVHFRPKKDWKGDGFGFDWMRQGDTNLITGSNVVFGDTNYEDIVAKQYTNATFTVLETDVNKYSGSFKKDDIMYSSLKNDYNIHIIPWKTKKDATGADLKDGTGAVINEEYYCSWLSLYPSKEKTIDTFVSLGNKNGNNPIEISTGFSNTKATLSLIIDIEEEPDVLRFEDNIHFVISPKEINVSGKGKGKHAYIDHITIECLDDFSSDQTLIINAIKKDNAGIEQKLLAGKLNIWANHESNRKKAKVLLINVITPEIVPTRGRRTGNLIGQKELFEKYLRQALIETDVSTEIIDVSTDINFQPSAKYVKNDQIAAYYSGSPTPTGFTNLEDYLYNLLKARLKAGDPASENKYDDYFKAIYLGENGGYVDSAGVIQGLNGYSSGKSVVLFLSKNDQTAAHEFLHSFKLHHSFTNKEANSDALFTYEYKKTENLMDYSHHIPQERYSLWHWQWLKANSSII
ncbi:phage baseplate assembly protein V [Pedobacter nototheniae]|uniref:phage baseplate assembly protein V n=2 Tax=Pedobacter nototheniae TaxID=2488994 RepID=UPI00103B1433|nr:phage baseplate assembly protein V [Pedobacter nototheniae]